MSVPVSAKNKIEELRLIDVARIIHILIFPNKTGNGVKHYVFNNLEDVIAFCNGAGNQVSNQVIRLVERELGSNAIDILNYLSDAAQSSKEILLHIGISNQSKNKKNNLDPLLASGLVRYTVPENPKDRNQRYQITDLGMRLLQLIEE